MEGPAAVNLLFALEGFKEISASRAFQVISKVEVPPIQHNVYTMPGTLIRVLVVTRDE